MNNINNFKEFQKKFTPEIDKYIESYYNQKIANIDKDWLRIIYSDIKEFCLRDGKRIRPLLFLIGYYGYCENESDVKYNDIIKIASLLEIMHSFLLIHDDVIDKAELRRGKKSMHVINREKFNDYTSSLTLGQDIAVTTGDMMAVESLGIIAELNLDALVKNRFIKYFSETYTNTARGQILDILYSLPKKIEPEKNIPYEISEYKTSFYTISYPLVMGYIISGKNDAKEIEKIMDFSKQVGLCFQFRDDLLGAFATDEKIGKSADSDIEEGKYTFLIQYTIEKLEAKDREMFTKLFLKVKKNSREIKKIKDYMLKVDIKNYALNKIEKLGCDSIEKMKNIKMSDNIKLVLNDVIHSIMKVNM